jgi:hypothetical protein
MRGLQLSATGHASAHTPFNRGRQIFSCDKFKRNGAATLAEWRQLGSA